jgi:WD40 repeat protein
MRRDKVVWIMTALCLLSLAILGTTLPGIVTAQQMNPTNQQATINAGVEARFTQTADAYLDATIDAAFNVALTATAQLTPTRTSIPATSQDDIMATGQANVQNTVNAINATTTAQVLPTLTSTSTPTASPTTQPVAHEGEVQRESISVDNANEVEELWRIGNGSINSTVYAPDGSSFALSGALGIWIYDTADLEAEPRLLPIEGNFIIDIVYTADSETIITVDLDDIVYYWDVRSGDLLDEFALPTDIGTETDLSSDGHWVVIGSFQEFSVYDLETQQRVITLEEPNEERLIRNIAISSDGARVATGSYRNPTYIWDLDSGEIIAELPVIDDLIYGFNFSPNGKLFVTQILSDVISIWDIRRDEEVVSLTFDIQVSRFGFNADDSQFAIGTEEGLLVWNTRDLLNGQGISDARVYGENAFYSPSFSADGTILMAIDRLGAVQLWDTDSGDEIARVGHYTNAWQDVVINADTQQVMSFDILGLHYWDTATGTEVELTNFGDDFTATHRITLSEDGSRLAASQGNEIFVLDTASGEIIAHFDDTEEGYASEFELSADGHLLAIGKREEGIFVWDVDAEEIIQHFEAVGNILWSLTMSHDGTKLAAGYSGNLRVWDIESGDELFSPPMEQFSRTQGVQFNADDSLFAYHHGDGVFTVVTTDRWREVSTIEQDSFQFSVEIAFSPDNSVLAIAASNLDETVISLFDLETGEYLETLEGHTLYIRRLFFTADGSLLISGGVDGTVRIWGIPPND